MPTSNERLARIETNVEWLVKEFKEIKESGYPRCATIAEKVSSLERTRSRFYKTLLTGAPLTTLAALAWKWFTKNPGTPIS